MTCIAARLTPAGGLVMAADSCISLGECQISGTAKIRRTDNWGLLGTAGSCRAEEAYSHVWESAGATLRGVIYTLGRLPDAGDAQYLLRVGTHLVHVGSDGWGYRIKGQYYAIGSGAEVALGALCCGASPRRAVAAACHHRRDCSEPVLVMTETAPRR